MTYCENEKSRIKNKNDKLKGGDIDILVIGDKILNCGVSVSGDGCL